MTKKVVLAGACRTAIGKMGGALSNTPAAELSQAGGRRNHPQPSHCDNNY